MLEKKTVVIITDCYDVAANEIRAAILSEVAKVGSGQLIEIEPVVSVKPFSLINASFVFRLMAEDYPASTIFLFLINPLKKRPERLIGRTTSKNFLFVGANTGAFEWFLRDFGTIMNLMAFYKKTGNQKKALTYAMKTEKLIKKEFGKKIYSGLKMQKSDFVRFIKKEIKGVKGSNKIPLSK